MNCSFILGISVTYNVGTTVTVNVQFSDDIIYFMSTDAIDFFLNNYC